MIKKIIATLLLAASTAAAVPTNWIYNGVLQTDLKGGTNGGTNYNITNVNNVSASNFIGNGSQLTGVIAGSATNVPTLTAGTNVTIITNGSPNTTNYVISATNSGGSATNAILTTNGYGTNTILSNPILTNATVAVGLTMAAGATNNITNNLPANVVTNGSSYVLATNGIATNLIATNGLTLSGTGNTVSLVLKGGSPGGATQTIQGTPAGVVFGSVLMANSGDFTARSGYFGGNMTVTSNLTVDLLSSFLGGITNSGRYDFSNSQTSASIGFDTNANYSFVNTTGDTNLTSSNGLSGTWSTNGSYAYRSNGNIVLSGNLTVGSNINGIIPANIVTNGETGVTLGGTFSGQTNFASSNSPSGVTGLVSATGGSTPYANNYYPGVPVGFESWPSYGGNFTGTNLTNELNAAWAKCPQLFNQPMPFWVVIDGNWAQTNSDGSLYRNPTTGQLAVNTNLFSQNFANELAFIHSFRAVALLYTEFLNEGPAVYPWSLGTNIPLDAQTFANWGFDGAKCDSPQSLNDLVRFESAFRQNVTNRVCYFMCDTQFGFDSTSATNQADAALWAGALSGTVFCPNADIAWPTWNINFLAIITNANVCASNINNSRPGIWQEPRDLINNAPNPINYTSGKLHAILGSAMRATGFYNVTSAQVNWLGNPELLAIQQDPLHVVGTPLLGIGSQSTYQVFVKPMIDGNAAIAIVNCTTNTTQNVTLYMTNLGIGAGTNVFVRDAFNQTNLSLTNTSIVLSIAAKDCYLLRLYATNTGSLTGIAGLVDGPLTINGNLFLSSQGTAVTNNAIWSDGTDLWINQQGSMDGISFSALGNGTKLFRIANGITASYQNIVGELGTTIDWSTYNYGGAAIFPETTFTGGVTNTSQQPFSGNGSGLTNLPMVSSATNASYATNSGTANLASNVVAGATNQSITSSGTNLLSGVLCLSNSIVVGLVAGGNSDVPTGTNAQIFINSGPGGPYGINGLVAGNNGRLLTVRNNTGYALTLTNYSGAEATAANRINTGTGGTSSLTTTNNPGYVQLIYNANGTNTQWEIISITP